MWRVNVVWACPRRLQVLELTEGRTEPSGETMKIGGAIFALQGPPQGNLVIKMTSAHVFDKRR